MIGSGRRRLGVFLVIALGLQGCTETIVRDGSATSSIIVPDNAPVEVLRAARELQSYVQKTSGAELPIRAESAPRKERVEIRLAVTPLGVHRGGDPGTEIVHEDGYAIQSGGRMITILGGGRVGHSTEPTTSSNAPSVFAGSCRRRWAKTSCRQRRSPFRISPS